MFCSKPSLYASLPASNIRHLPLFLNPGLTLWLTPSKPKSASAMIPSLCTSLSALNVRLFPPSLPYWSRQYPKLKMFRWKTQNISALHLLCLFGLTFKLKKSALSCRLTPPPHLSCCRSRWNHGWERCCSHIWWEWCSHFDI